ncbi:MAG: sensor histidine kinase [Adlercreutzia equolifaciens]
MFVWCLVSWGLLQAELNGIAPSVAGPHCAVHAGVCALAGRGGHRVRGHAPGAAVRTGAPGAVAHLDAAHRVPEHGPGSGRRLRRLRPHEHQERTRAIEERAIAAERGRDAEARRRVEAERVSIAREVHDITAHSLSAVSIQAAAAERLVDRDPAAAKEAIAEVRRTAKGALEEIRAMIGVLRAGEGPAETTPTQGTDRMGDLVSYLEGADIEVTLDETAYDRACVPAFIDVALFGIAREAATNIVRHAGARRATLALSTKREGFAELIVDDDGKGLAAPAAAAGHHGLLGMRERARLLQGTFSASPSPLGGVRIAVSVPLSQKEETHE